MIDANAFFTIILSVLGSILLIMLIVLTYKLITTITRINNVLDEVDKRVEKFDRIFKVADLVTDNMALVSDKIVDGISGFIRSLVNKRKGKEDENNE